jgi:uncharacterized protein involved in tolerance to divalent cations
VALWKHIREDPQKTDLLQTYMSVIFDSGYSIRDLVKRIYEWNNPASEYYEPELFAKAKAQKRLDHIEEFAAAIQKRLPLTVKAEVPPSLVKKIRQIYD